MMDILELFQLGAVTTKLILGLANSVDVNVKLDGMGQKASGTMNFDWACTTIVLSPPTTEPSEDAASPADSVSRLPGDGTKLPEKSLASQPDGAGANVTLAADIEKVPLLKA